MKSDFFKRYFCISVHFGSLVFRLFSFAFFLYPQSYPRNGQVGCKVIPATARGGAKLSPQRKGGVQRSPRKGEGGCKVNPAKERGGAKLPPQRTGGGCKDERASLKRVRIRVQNRAYVFCGGKFASPPFFCGDNFAPPLSFAGVPLHPLALSSKT